MKLKCLWVYVLLSSTIRRFLQHCLFVCKIQKHQIKINWKWYFVVCNIIHHSLAQHIHFTIIIILVSRLRVGQHQLHCRVIALHGVVGSRSHKGQLVLRPLVRWGRELGSGGHTGTLYFCHGGGMRVEAERVFAITSMLLIVDKLEYFFFDPRHWG